MLNQELFVYIYGVVMTTPSLPLIAIFCGEWLPYLILAYISLRILMRHAGESKQLSGKRFSLGTFWSTGKELTLLLLPAVLAWCLVDIIKFAYPSPRPFHALNFIPLVSVSDPMGAFPSGHATAFAALATTIYLVNKKRGYWFLAGALLIGLGRVASGVHWPFDVLAGFLFGACIALISQYIFLKLQREGVLQ